jgi:Protein of unknown function (DUF2442)
MKCGAVLRIRNAVPLSGYHLRLTLTDGTVVERAVGHLLNGPVFDAIRCDLAMFAKVRVERGTVVWPGGVDLCPDTVLRNGPAPDGASSSPAPATAEPN